MEPADECVSWDVFVAARGLQTPTWIYDIDQCRVVYANASACDMWQAATEEELRARDMSKDMSATVAKRLKQYQADFIERNASFHEMWTLYPNGKPTSAMVVFRGFRLPDGRMAMQCEVLGQADDEPDNLRSAEALLHTDVMIALFSLDGPALYSNPAARNVLEETTSNLGALFVRPVDLDLMMFELDGAGEHRQVAKVYTAQGQRWFDLSAKLCSDAVTGKPAVLLTAIDVSELKIARDQARYLADRDQLTGCFNRTFLQQHVANLRQSDANRHALLYFDIDRFKQINDRFGHEAGDDVLKAVAARTQNTVGEGGIVVRLGGDEFVILIEAADERARLEPLVKRLFAAFDAPVQCGTIGVSTSISMGIAWLNPSETDVSDALREADIALYVSKHQGRGRYTFYKREMGLQALERTKIEEEIREALQRREFTLQYQPRIKLLDRQVISVEGLVRWNHPERGQIMPDSFISICEETGMIEQLGQQVLEMGFEQAIAWYKAGMHIQISLNISPRQFSDDALMRTLERFAASPDFRPGMIELEITENVLIGDLDGISAKLQAITDLGYTIAIDDFGTGYSNLSYISRIPLHCLKIDQSFIQQLPSSGPIILLILALGKQIGATIVAEGIESAEQLDWLCQHGCDQGQGYHIARPIPIDRIDDVLRELKQNGDPNRLKDVL